MKFRKLFLTGFILLIALVFCLMLFNISGKKSNQVEPVSANEDKQAAYQYARWKYDADLVRDPATGEVPFGLRKQEIEFASTIPERGSSNPFLRTTIQNTYLPAGPNNIGGRTRALAYDIRYNGTTNRVILSGSISGGIFRSSDGGNTWTNVTPQNEILNVSTLVQDPRAGNQDTWYAGGGEYLGNSADGIGAGYLAHGLLKSTDNGITWTRLPLDNITDINSNPIPAGIPERFDHPFDYVHKLAINPVNGTLYVAGHRRLMRSSDGGSTFQTVFGSTTASFAANGQGDIVITSTGSLFFAFTGASADFNLRGVWRSTTGNQGSWTRLAGGNLLGIDSVAGWRGNSYNFQVVGGSNFYNNRRILLALAPSNDNILYVMYENGLSNASPGFDKEADLFKLDLTSGLNWTNLSANMPDFPGGNHEATDPIALQGGYNMFLTVKPNDPNFVIVGGTSLYRSTNGFANTSNTSWIGGYGNTLPTLTFYPNSHPDIHNLVFSPNPLTPNEAICANDGGLQITNDITASGSTVSWANLNNYQTLQYYHVGIDPGSGRNNFAGGAQDNGTRFRDKLQVLGTAAVDSNNHPRILGGDGASVGITLDNAGVQYCYSAIQLGGIRRVRLNASLAATDIRPTGLTPSFAGSSTEFGEFVTKFHLNPDNTELLYYVNFNRLYRTSTASTVTSSGWTEMTGVSGAVNATNGTNVAIRALASSRGTYISAHSLYIGTTNGNLFRLDDPRNISSSTVPANITPPGNTNLNIQDIAVNPNNDNEILVVVSNYGVTSGNALNNVVNIWWTNNAKSATPTWRQAEGNLAGTTNSGYISARSCMIAVKKDVLNNPVTEYYVGTAAGLFAVENLGTTLLASGTPNWQREAASTLKFAVISSLAYRPVDNVLVVGTHGNGMYYTSLGTPNLVTGINDPVMNDRSFITAVFPTAGSAVVQYQIGNRPEIRKISIQLYNLQGQVVYQNETAYQNGVIYLGRFAKGPYILSIYSDNRKYRHVQKLIH